MNLKTSVTLSDELIEEIDQLIGDHEKRSEFVEIALRDYIGRAKRKESDAQDLTIINACNERLNRESEEISAFQIEWQE